MILPTLFFSFSMVAAAQTQSQFIDVRERIYQSEMEVQLINAQVLANTESIKRLDAKAEQQSETISESKGALKLIGVLAGVLTLLQGFAIFKGRRDRV